MSSRFSPICTPSTTQNSTPCSFPPTPVAANGIHGYNGGTHQSGVGNVSEISSTDRFTPVSFTSERSHSLSRSSSQLTLTPLQLPLSTSSTPTTSSSISSSAEPRARSFACLECQQVFSTRFSLKRHEKLHKGDRPFICPNPDCKRPFSEKCSLIRHLRTHTGERPYQCSFPNCRRTFADRTNHKRHEMTHTGTRPYYCTHTGCDRGFFRKKHLKKHLAMVHHQDMVEEK